MTGKRDYALDMSSPVLHVVSELDRVAPAALSIRDLAATYKHPIPADLHRVKLHEGCNDNREAIDWLMSAAISELDGQVGTDGDGGFVLTKPFDEIEYGQFWMGRTPDIYANLHDPFNPMSGRFTENVRRVTGKDTMDELRESMRAFGWIEQLPAIKDERGVVLVGHRRLAVAAELGIEPVWWHENGRPYITIGNGDEGDARRFALAIGSNLGSKGFTPEERKSLAEYLYGEREWTMTKIADALNVSHKTISKDLATFVPKVQKSKPNPPGKKGRPQGSRSPRKDVDKLTRDQNTRVDAMVADGAGPQEIADTLGVSYHTARLAEVKAAARLEQSNAETPHDCTCPSCGNIHLPRQPSP